MENSIGSNLRFNEGSGVSNITAIGNEEWTPPAHGFVGGGAVNAVTDWAPNTAGGFSASKGAAGLLAMILARKAAWEAASPPAG